MISIVIPVYNSEKTLAILYDRLRAVLDVLCAKYEIIMVDDGSTDDSYKSACQLHDMDKRVKVITLSKNFGQQNAIMCGLRYSTGDRVVIMDDDLQNPPEEIRKLIDKLNEGYDVVYGIPMEKEYSVYRSIGARLRDLLFDRICRKPADIKVGSFRAIRGSLVQKVIQDRTSFVYISAITFKYTVRAANVAVRHDAREYGRSNYSMLKLAGLFMKLMINYSFLSGLLANSSQPQYVIKEAKV